MKVTMIRANEKGFTTPSVWEKENMLCLSVTNWKVQGISLLFCTLIRRLVELSTATSPNETVLADRDTSKP